MENLPLYISFIFGLTTLVSVWLFCRAADYSNTTLVILGSWLIVQLFIGLSGFYTNTKTFPPRILLLVLPPLLFIAILFFAKGGRKYIDQLNIKTLTLLHTIRVAVELILFLLLANKVIPQLMTFDGRNFDILSGLSAPFVFYFSFIRRKLSRKFYTELEYYLFGTIDKYCCYCNAICTLSISKACFQPAKYCNFIFSFCLVTLLHSTHYSIITLSYNKTIVKKYRILNR